MMGYRFSVFVVCLSGSIRSVDAYLASVFAQLLFLWLRWLFAQAVFWLRSVFGSGCWLLAQASFGSGCFLAQAVFWLRLFLLRLFLLRLFLLR